MISKIFPSFFILILYIIAWYDRHHNLVHFSYSVLLFWLSDLIKYQLKSNDFFHWTSPWNNICCELIFAPSLVSCNFNIRRRFWLLILYFFLLLFLYALQILLTFRLYAFISACACAFFRWFRSGCYPVLTSEIWTKMDRIDYFLRANSEFLK